VYQCYTSTIRLVGQKLLTMGKNIKIKSYRLSLTKVVLMKVAILLETYQTDRKQQMIVAISEIFFNFVSYAIQLI
jgi:hypothetical protein